MGNWFGTTGHSLCGVGYASRNESVWAVGSHRVVVEGISARSMSAGERKPRIRRASIIGAMGFTMTVHPCEDLDNGARM